MNDTRPPSPTLVDGAIWVVSKAIGFGQYDFDFEENFPCAHPYELPNEVTAIARMGSAPDYLERFEEMARWNIQLINSPEEYQKSSLLPHWYPEITEFTPRSLWYEEIPTVEEIQEEFEFPIFIKGERQTNKHSRDQSIIESKEQLGALIDQWASEKILWWQRLVCREFIPLKSVSKDHGSGIPKSFEFRTFWLHGEIVGVGRYWVAQDYTASPEDVDRMTEIGGEVARRLMVPFLVIDFAETLEGEWIVIECNDGQDSGYAGVNAREMWRKVIERQKALTRR